MATEQGNPGRKPIALPPLAVAVALIMAGVTGFWAWWDGYSCEAQTLEARDALLRIHELERGYFAKTKTYAPMAPCSFVQRENEAQSSFCVSRIGFNITGTSHFAYQVVLSGDGYIATAVGAEGGQVGNVLQIDEKGNLDTSGARCLP